MFFLSFHPGSICCLHNEEKYIDSNIKPFNESSLEKCRSILEVRKLQNLKYSTVTLPSTVDLIQGYHTSCYRRFVALSKAHRINIETTKMESSKNSAKDISVSQTTPTTSKSNIISVRTTRSDVKSPKPAYRKGSFQRVCLFCDKGRKKVKGVEQRLINVEIAKHALRNT